MCIHQYIFSLPVPGKRSQNNRRQLPRSSQKFSKDANFQTGVSSMLLFLAQGCHVFPDEKRQSWQISRVEQEFKFFGRTLQITDCAAPKKVFL